MAGCRDPLQGFYVSAVWWLASEMTFSHCFLLVFTLNRVELRCIMASILFSWIPYSVGSHFYMKMLKQPYVEVHVIRSWGLLSTARLVCHLGSRSSSPSGVFRWPQSWLMSWLQPSWKSLSQTTKQSCSWISDTHKLWDNQYSLFKATRFWDNLYPGASSSHPLLVQGRRERGVKNLLSFTETLVLSWKV